MIKTVLWYLGVIIATILLVIAFVMKRVDLSIIAFILAMLLNKYSDWTILPKIYRKQGITNEVFSGKKDVK